VGNLRTLRVLCWVNNNDWVYNNDDNDKIYIVPLCQEDTEALQCF